MIRSDRYDAFGNELTPDSADTNPMRYCGEYLDFETGTYYLRARYYDPVVGRFTQQDTILSLSATLANGQKVIDPLSLNLYTYTHNNPVLYVDENGHWIHVAVGALVGGIVGVAINVSVQAFESGGDFSKIDLGRVMIAGGSGAIGGLLTSVGMGGVAAGALIGGIEDLATQIYDKGINNVDLFQVGISTVSGAALGKVGDKLSGIMGIPDVPVAHLKSMDATLIHRVGKAQQRKLLML